MAGRLGPLLPNVKEYFVSQARLKSIKLPEFGVPRFRPALTAELYQARFSRFLDRAWAAGLDAIALYADREHCANLAYLTGFEPRFEEALLIVARGKDPVILTGPENQGAAGLNHVSAGVALYPPFGLPGQAREKTPDLGELLRASGLASGNRIGAIGWKYFIQHETPTPSTWLDLPSYLADALRAVGPTTNATRILTDPSTGLRATLELEELAQFEFAATHGSESIKRILRGVRPGMTEFEAATLMTPIGLPLGAHTMVSSGDRARSNGLNSPSDRVIGAGEAFTTAFCYWGSLTSRAGFLVHDASEMAPGTQDYIERLVAPYFETAARWYETIGLGVTGGEMDRLVRERLDTPFFNLILNPGHLIHIDEWMNTPIYPGSSETFHSSSAVQLDIIPATGSAYFTTNIEDGIALLDECGRAEYAERFPESWSRIEARREFMAAELGIVLKPETLPFSNTAGYLTPFILASDMAMSLR